MGLKEILEAKRAKEAAEKANVPTSFEKVVEQIPAEDRKNLPINKEVAATQAPLSFAEKMRLKKEQESLGKLSPIAQVVEQQSNGTADKTVSIVQSPAVVSSGEAIDAEAALRTGMLVPALEAHPVIVPSEPTVADDINPETAQAYADLKNRIDSLEALDDGPPLEGAMKELKNILMKNPAAVELMLDRDIGQMVLALRRITKEAVVEAAAEKKTGSKKRTKALTVEEIDKVFDEL